MAHIRLLLEEIELHDSSVECVVIKGDGSVEVILDLDEVWNAKLGSHVMGIRFKSVYEVSDYKIDRFNVIGMVEVEDSEGYDKAFVTHSSNEPETATIVYVEFVAGGSLSIVCSGEADLIRHNA